MAIQIMERLTLIAHADSKQKLLKKLQHLGSVEVITSSVEGAAVACAPESLARLEGRLADVREAYEVVRPYDENKPSFLTPKPLITLSALENMPERFTEADELIGKIRRLSDDLSALKTRRQRLRNRITALEPYTHFDAPMETVGTGRYTVSLLGAIPADSIQKYDKIREDYAETAYFEDLDGGRDIKPVFVVMLRSVQESLIGELKYIGLAEAYTKELYGTPQDIISDSESEYASLEQEAGEYEEIAKGLAEQKAILKEIEDYLLCEITRGKML